MKNEDSKTEQPCTIQSVMPCYFVPKTDLFYLTKNSKYKINYTDKGREIIDDRGLRRIVRPMPSELSR